MKVLISSGNGTNSTILGNYVYVTLERRVEIFFLVFLSILVTYVITANGLILNFIAKIQYEKKRMAVRRGFQRNVTNTFIQSLAMSNLLGGLVNFAVLVEPFSSQLASKDVMICRATKFAILVFAVLNFYNLFVIGVERYLATFRPFNVPSDRVVKGLLVGSWVWAGCTSLAPAGTFKVFRVQDEKMNSYTLMCMYDDSKTEHRVIFATFIIINYVIPTTISVVTNLKVLKYIRNRAPQNWGAKLERNKRTNAFITLTFSYMIPYMIFIIYMAFRKEYVLFQESIPIEIVMKRWNAFLVFGNSLISPTVQLYQMPRLRRMLVAFVCHNFQFLRVGSRCSNVIAVYSKKKGVFVIKNDTSLSMNSL